MCTLIQVIALFLILLMGTANAEQTSSEQSETGAGNHRFIIGYTTLSRLRAFSSLFKCKSITWHTLCLRTTEFGLQLKILSTGDHYGEEKRQKEK